MDISEIQQDDITISDGHEKLILRTKQVLILKKIYSILLD
jgi:hypothetical protein